MSIVEKSLKKLQASGAAARTMAQPSSLSALPSGPPTSSARPPEAPNARAAGHDALQSQSRVTIGASPRVARIDPERLLASRLLPPEHQQREIAHQYRTLKRPLLRNIQELSADAAAASAACQRAVMVSSALPGEGKTFTSINLALSLALEKDHSVVLVDGDVPKPHVTETFGLKDEPGLFDVLLDATLPLESVIVPTDMEGLSILPVGRRSESATEVLASARMRQVMASLEQSHPQALIVVDSPPILLTSEARVLASLFGQVLLVVRAGSTPQQAVLEALEIVGNGPRVGLVLNQAVHEGPSGNYYGYGSYYGSGPGGGTTAPARPNRDAPEGA